MVNTADWWRLYRCKRSIYMADHDASIMHSAYKQARKLWVYPTAVTRPPALWNAATAQKQNSIKCWDFFVSNHKQMINVIVWGSQLERKQVMRKAKATFFRCLVGEIGSIPAQYYGYYSPRKHCAHLLYVHPAVSYKDPDWNYTYLENKSFIGWSYGEEHSMSIWKVGSGLPSK